MLFDIIGKLAKGNTLVWMNSMLLSDYPIVYNTKVKTTKMSLLFIQCILSEYRISKAQFNQEARLETALIQNMRLTYIHGHL